MIEKKLNIILLINIILILALAGIMTGRLNSFLKNNIHLLPYLYPESEVDLT
jgi:hypothetical protein